MIGLTSSNISARRRAAKEPRLSSRGDRVRLRLTVGSSPLPQRSHGLVAVVMFYPAIHSVTPYRAAKEPRLSSRGDWWGVEGDLVVGGRPQRSHGLVAVVMGLNPEYAELAKEKAAKEPRLSSRGDP